MAQWSSLIFSFISQVQQVQLLYIFIQFKQAKHYMIKYTGPAGA